MAFFDFWKKEPQTELELALAKIGQKNMTWTVANGEGKRDYIVELRGKSSDGIAVEIDEYFEDSRVGYIIRIDSKAPNGENVRLLDSIVYKFQTSRFAPLDAFAKKLFPPGFLRTSELKRREQERAKRIAESTPPSLHEQMVADVKKQFWNS